MKKKVIAVVWFLLFSASIVNSHDFLLANNHKDSEFSFKYYGDGSEYGLKPRRKEDDTAAYMKNNASSSSVSVSVAGTNDKNYRGSVKANWCSDDYTIKPGKYKYMSNTVYNNYKYAYLLIGKDDKKKHTISGKWSPDNICGKY